MTLLRLDGRDFIENRSKLIDFLSRGELTKREFLEENYRICSQVKPNSLETCKSFDDALYRYEYYNALAKYHIMQFMVLKAKKRCSGRVLSCEKKIKNYYAEKDRAILCMMSLSDDSEISAYYIKTSSNELRYLLFEIVFLNYDKVILHSKNQGIKKELVSRGIFSEELKDSLIKDYINCPY